MRPWLKTQGRGKNAAKTEKEIRSMNKLRNSAFVFLFLCGLGAYALQSPQGGPPPQGGQGSGGRGPMSPADQVKELTEKLSLTDDQQGKIKTILEDTRDQMQKIRADDSLSQEDKMAKGRALRETANGKIRELLTDEQKKKFDQLEQERRERMRQRQQGGGEPPK
jgi:Spy/CpxP family protein refolding chaperone